ncbi:19130_t:CDS:2, partial [Gigaspora rosea]
MELNRTIEERYLGIQTVLTFIERLYGIKVVHSNLANNCSQPQPDIQNTNKIKIENNEAQGILKMIKKLAAKHIVSLWSDYYLVNYITVIYNGTDEEAFAEILCKYKKNGDNIFFPTEKQINEKDPYRPNISKFTLNSSETNLDNLNRLSIIIEDCNNQDLMFTPSTDNNIPESVFISSIQPTKSRNVWCMYPRI